MAQTFLNNVAFITAPHSKEGRGVSKSESKDSKMYGYCKSKGFKGVGYLESEYRMKKCEKSKIVL
ncbi:hypothetical protein L873DRAFT_1814673 [Choiromyces venosus 120613-1]|uniref:Uncharacterized protein n=1 Tax=Choiromyces venosus 120613-1 TaxID=1336337 RepID=A0A3N4JAH5_9PEZI|nr:hypothetical protein L873DRAFT_1814673 [Choiromyces venosus 120613-1]